MLRDRYFLINLFFVSYMILSIMLVFFLLGISSFICWILLIIHFFSFVNLYKNRNLIFYSYKNTFRMHIHSFWYVVDLGEITYGELNQIKQTIANLQLNVLFRDSIFGDLNLDELYFMSKIRVGKTESLILMEFLTDEIVLKLTKKEMDYD